MSRTAVTVAVMALAGLLAGCGDPAPRPTPPTPPSPAPPVVSPYAEGITTPADIFGPDCPSLAAAIADSPVTMATRPVAEAIAQNPRLRIFADAVARAGLVDRLNRLVGATVLAPTDDAFARYRDAIGPQRYDALMANPQRLASLVTYHVIDKRYDRTGLIAANRGVATLYGGIVTAAAAGDTLTVADGARDSAKVLCGNIPTANGTVFMTNGVLVPDPDLW